MKTINDILPPLSQEYKANIYLLVGGRSKPYSSVCWLMGRQYILVGEF